MESSDGQVSDGDLVAFVRAVSNGDLAQVRVALEAGFPPNGRAGDGLPPLRYAAEHQQVAVIELLIDDGADVDAQTERDGWTVLHHAVDADVDAAVQSNSIAIDWSCTGCLLRRGADQALRNLNGATAGDIASSRGERSAESFGRLVSACSESLFNNVSRILDALDDLYDGRAGAEESLLQTLYERAPAIEPVELRQIIGTAIAKVRLDLERVRHRERLNSVLLRHTDELRLACAAVDDPDL